MPYQSREKEAARKKAARIANPDKFRARYKAYREANLAKELVRAKVYHASHSAEERAYTKAWRLANPEKCRIYRKASRVRHAAKERVAQKARYDANAESKRAYARQWAKLHPAMRAASESRRKARRRSAPGSGITGRQWEAELVSSLGLCAYCNGRGAITLDHIEPLARGGAHDVGNVAVSCARCNASKNDRPLLIWLALRAAA